MKEVIVHIGPWKTGSTSIQRCLMEWRAYFQEVGFTYRPDIGENNQLMANALAVKTDSSLGVGEDALTWTQQHSSDSTLVFSSEDFARASVSKVKAWRDSLGAHRLTVVVFFREPVGWLLSQFQQVNRGVGVEFAQLTDRESGPHRRLIEALLPSRIAEVWSGSGAVMRPVFLSPDSDVVMEFLKAAGMPIPAELRSYRENEGWTLREAAFTGRYVTRAHEYARAMKAPERVSRNVFTRFLGGHTLLSRPMHEFSGQFSDAELVDVGAFSIGPSQEILEWRDEWIADALQVVAGGAWAADPEAEAQIEAYREVPLETLVFPSSECLARLPTNGLFESLARTAAASFVAFGQGADGCWIGTSTDLVDEDDD